MPVDMQRLRRGMAAILMLSCYLCAHAQENVPAIDLIELLGDMEDGDTGWFDTLMSKVEQKDQATEGGNDGKPRPQEVRNAK